MSASAPNVPGCFDPSRRSEYLRRGAEVALHERDRIEEEEGNVANGEVRDYLARFDSDGDTDRVILEREDGRWRISVDLNNDGTKDLILDDKNEPRIFSDGPQSKYSRDSDTDREQEAGALAVALDEDNSPERTYQEAIRILGMLPQARDGLTKAELEAIAWHDNAEYTVEQIAVARYLLVGSEGSSGRTPFQNHATQIEGQPVLMPPWPQGTEEDIKRALDNGKCAYPPFADEAGAQGKVRTNYAYPDDRMKTLFVGIDNGRATVSDEERRFVETCAQWAKENGYAVIVLAHKPPNIEGHHANTQTCWRDWVAELRENVYSNVLLVTGHVHPSEASIDPEHPDVDIDGPGDGKTDTDLIILPAQGRGSRENRMRLVRITMYEHGKVIEELEVEGEGDSAVLKPTGNTVAMNNEGMPASADELGAKKGVVFSMSDLQKPDGYESFFKAVARAAKESADEGLPVAYTVSGDISPGAEKSIPVTLPQHEFLFWVPGNHCYRDNDSLEDVVEFLTPPGDETFRFAVDYVE